MAKKKPPKISSQPIIDTIEYQCIVCGKVYKEFDYMGSIKEAKEKNDYIRLPCGHIAFKMID